MLLEVGLSGLFGISVNRNAYYKKFENVSNDISG